MNPYRYKIINKYMGKEKLFVIEEFQLINKEGIKGLENYIWPLII